MISKLEIKDNVMSRIFIFSFQIQSQHSYVSIPPAVGIFSSTHLRSSS